jgi:hypothetical protein
MTSYGIDDPLLHGMQLGIFEIIWPACPWIQRIWIKKGDRQVHFFVEAANAPDGQEWERCQRHVRMMVEEGARLNAEAIGNGHTIRYGTKVPLDEDYLELMSDRIFEQIAREHAPWRLSDGR